VAAAELADDAVGDGFELDEAAAEGAEVGVEAIALRLHC